MKRYLILSALLLIGALLGASAKAAPFLSTAETYGPGPGQPTKAFCLLDGREIAGRIKVVTGGVKPECDLIGNLWPVRDLPARIVVSNDAGTAQGAIRTVRVSNDGGCSPATTGGVSCAYQARALPDSTPTTWSRIANEYVKFTVTGTRAVRYGAGSTWVTKTLTGVGYCTNDFFGSDPAYGKAKECQVEVP